MLNNTDDEKTLNMVSLLKEGLQKRVKSALTESIVNEPLEQFDAMAKELRANYEASLNEKIKAEVDLISFREIEGLRNNLQMRDELHVFLHHKVDQLTEQDVKSSTAVALMRAPISASAVRDFREKK